MATDGRFSCRSQIACRVAVQQTLEQYSLILPSAAGLLTPSTWREPTQ